MSWPVSVHVLNCKWFEPRSHIISKYSILAHTEKPQEHHTFHTESKVPAKTTESSVIL